MIFLTLPACDQGRIWGAVIELDPEVVDFQKGFEQRVNGLQPGDTLTLKGGMLPH